MSADAGDPVGVYFGTTSGEVWASRDEGRTWKCLAAHLPEDKAYAIHGVDAEIVLTLEVEQVGAEFWAKWGKKAAASAIARS